MRAACEKRTPREHVVVLLAARIFDELRVAPNGLTRTEISKLLGRHGRGDEIDEALRRLEEAGLAVRGTMPTRGRSAELWLATDRARQAQFAEAELAGGAAAEQGPGMVALPAELVERLLAALRGCDFVAAQRVGFEVQARLGFANTKGVESTVRAGTHGADLSGGRSTK